VPREEASLALLMLLKQSLAGLPRSCSSLPQLGFLPRPPSLLFKTRSMPAKAESIETPPCAPPGYSALKASSADVLLELTISNKCGQAFRWRSVQVWEPRLPPAAVTTSSWSSAVKKEPEDSGVESQALSKPELEEQTEWSLCLHDRVVLVRQDIDRGYIYHRTLVPQTGRPEGALDAISAEPDSSLSQETNEWLADYLSLRVPVTELTAYWSSRDPIFAKQAPRFMGLRMLRQDPWECLCAFICSSNNNISRIGQMVSKLCTEFTPPMLELTYPSPPVSSDPEDSEAEAGASDLNLLMVYHPFPSAADWREKASNRSSVNSALGIVPNTSPPRLRCSARRIPSRTKPTHRFRRDH